MNMPAQKRFLVSTDLSMVPSIKTDVLVIGSGVAGLSAALAAAETSQVMLVTKSELAESASRYAQGGIAAALNDDDSVEMHVNDTLAAGQGICKKDAVGLLVSEGIERCRELIDWGTPFDREDGHIATTMEGAHSCRRILHADGDATGRAIVNTLMDKVRQHRNIRIQEGYFTIDLLHQENECFGALLQDRSYGRLLQVETGATVVATGGLGRLYRETTNPDVATGDGYAICFRAGAVLEDMEFVQFHPTTLYVAGAPRFLISESVRGEGAYLLNCRGERFMNKYAEQGELAPRDVVSRSILREMHETGSTHVFLDLRHLGEELTSRRFPNIKMICKDFNIDIDRELVPVRPAAHYMMGGVQTDLDAKTTVARLFAAGEVACTGVHGANRLASNSLLEGIVFGHRAGVNAVACAKESKARVMPVIKMLRSHAERVAPLDLDDTVMSLKSLTWRDLGVFRNEGQLENAMQTIARWAKYVMNEQFQHPRGYEVQNMLTLANVIAKAAYIRTESRGAHQRIDFPQTSKDWERHVALSIHDFESDEDSLF